MKRACIVFLVAAVSVVLFAMQAVAEGIPGDADHDNRLTGGELNSAVFAYLSGSGTLTLDDLRYAAFV